MYCINKLLNWPFTKWIITTNAIGISKGTDGRPDRRSPVNIAWITFYELKLNANINTKHKHQISLDKQTRERRIEKKMMFNENSVPASERESKYMCRVQLYKCKNRAILMRNKVKWNCAKYHLCSLVTCALFFNQHTNYTMEWNIVRKSVRGNCIQNEREKEGRRQKSWIRTLDPDRRKLLLSFFQIKEEEICALTLWRCSEQWPSRYYCFNFFSFYFISFLFKFNPNRVFLVSLLLLFHIPFFHVYSVYFCWSLCASHYYLLLEIVKLALPRNKQTKKK